MNAALIHGRLESECIRNVQSRLRTKKRSWAVFLIVNLSLGYGVSTLGIRWVVAPVIVLLMYCVPVWHSRSQVFMPPDSLASARTSSLVGLSASKKFL